MKKNSIEIYRKIKSFLEKEIKLKRGGNSAKYTKWAIRLNTGKLETICNLAHPNESYSRYCNSLAFYHPVCDAVDVPQNVKKTHKGFGSLYRFFIVIEENNFKESMEFVMNVKKEIAKFCKKDIKEKKKRKAATTRLRNKLKKNSEIQKEVANAIR